MTKTGIKFRVAFLGNFDPEFSTETDLAWTLEQLGWEVIHLQENRHHTEQVLACALDSDFFLWVHTHGWITPGKISMEEILLRLRDAGIPTVGVHLDRYWGIPEREEMMTRHPFFKCSELWTADGGHQSDFAAIGINHFWMPPAICMRHCWLGEKRQEYDCDVTFVGSRYYHPEWPWRREMVEWLASPERPFKVVRWGGDKPGVREQLNDIYASAKVVVGDSIFAGSPFYWSDRIPETMGRGGFIIHPHSEGMEHAGMGNYAGMSLKNLGEQIQYYLDPANVEERERMRMQGYEWTRQHGTYHNRMLTILNHLEMN